MLSEQAWREVAAELWESDSRLVHFYKKKYGPSHRDFFSDLADLLPRLMLEGVWMVWVKDAMSPNTANPIVRAYVRYRGKSEMTAMNFADDVEQLMTLIAKSLKDAAQARAILDRAA